METTLDRLCNTYTTDILEQVSDLDVAIKSAKSASASISDGKFACLVDGTVKKSGKEITIRSQTNVLSFPENYIRSWDMHGNKMVIILKTL